MNRQRLHLLIGSITYSIITLILCIWGGIWMLPIMGVILFFSRPLKRMVGLIDRYGNPVIFRRH